MTEIAHRAQGQTALTITDDQQMFNEVQLAQLRSIGVDTNSPAEVAMLFHQSKRTGLDPFNREIYMITRKGKPTIQTGIDGFYKIARRATNASGGTWGVPETLWCGEDGQWRDVWLSRKAPAAAKVTVERDGSRFTVVAVTEEYRAQGPLWDKMPARMIAKCAEALGIRKAFAGETSGLYTSEEMEQADSPANTPQQPQPQGGRFGLGGNFRAPNQTTTQPPQEDPVVMSDRTQWAAVNELMETIGITENADKGTEMQRWATEQGITRELGSMKALTADEADQFAGYLRQIANPEAA